MLGRGSPEYASVVCVYIYIYICVCACVRVCGSDM